MGKTLHHRKANIFSCSHRLLTFFLVSVFVLQQSCREAPKETRILFTGDILLSRNVAVEMEKRRSFPWEKLQSTFSAADLVIGNLEGAVGSASDSLSSTSGSPVFAIPETFIPLLAQAGFKGLSIENNHSRDLGDSGKQTTADLLYKAGLTPFSFENSPQFMKLRDITVAVVALNLVPGRDYKHQQIPSVEIKQKLGLAKGLSHMVIVIIHWGSELLDWPDQHQRDAAEWLVNNGADLIIGSHPHVVQQPELVEGKPVFFSLGNHLFDQKYAATKEGLMADCRILDGKFECSGIVTHTSENSFYPEISGMKKYDFPSVQLNVPLKVSGITLEGSTGKNTGEKIILKASSEEKKKFETHPMSLVSAFKSRLGGKEEYLITLENHYSNMDGSIGLRPYVYSVTKTGLTARWRGSTLAWPLLDAGILPADSSVLCALHRGDSFIDLNPENKNTRVAAYKWNGFGFSGINDEKTCEECKKYFGITKQ